MPELSILIVCYQSLDYIEKCLASVYEHVQGCRFEILLLDCSSDGTVELVGSKYPAVRLVDNSENLGFSRGNNVLATHAEGQYLLLLNADTYLTDDAVSDLVHTARQTCWSPLGALGGRTRRPDGRRDPGSRQAFPTLWSLAVAAFGGARWLNGALPETSTEPGRVQSLTGAFMLVPAEVWREMGGLDESFFAYCEEMDLCKRLRGCGYQVVMTPAAEVVHLGGGGSHRAQRTLMMTQAMMHYIRKHWSPTVAPLGGGLIWLHATLRTVAGRTLHQVFSDRRLLDLQTAFSDISRKPGTWWFGFESRDA